MGVRAGEGIVRDDPGQANHRGGGSGRDEDRGPLRRQPLPGREQARGTALPGDETGDPSLVSWARDYLKERYRSRETSCRAGPPAGPSDLGGGPAGPHQQGGQPSVRPVPRRQGRQGLLGHRRGAAGAARGPVGSTSWRRTGDSTGFACSMSQRPSRADGPGALSRGGMRRGVTASWSCVRRRAAVISCGSSLPDEGCPSWGTASTERRPFSRPRTGIAGSRCTRVS